MATLLPNVRQQFLGTNGAPLVGGMLYSYAAGTSTPLATFTDQSEATPNANPTILDANGMASIWIGSASYKFQLQDSLGTVLWTVDNVASIFDGSVSTLKIANGAVTTPKLPDGVLSADLAGRAKMALKYITTALIGDKQVTSAQMADKTITVAQTADGIGLLTPGAVIPFFGPASGTSCPVGYLTCDGASYLRTAYPNLFSVISTANGTADATHFNVPDLRGMFLRGVDNGAGNDPDAAGRTAAAPGGSTGNTLGSKQADLVGPHTHTIQLGTAGGNGSVPQGANTAVATNTTIVNTGTSETRPKNIYCNFLIKT